MNEKRNKTIKETKVGNLFVMICNACYRSLGITYKSYINPTPDLIKVGD